MEIDATSADHLTVSTTLEGGSRAAFSPMIQTSNSSSPVEEISVTIPATLLTAPTGFVRVKAH